MIPNANVLIRKLELFIALPDDDRRLLNEVVSRPRRVPSRTAIIREGDSPSDVHLVMDGLAMRCKTLKDGSRQIVAYLVPGDFCDLNVFILGQMDHDIETVSDCTMVRIPRDQVLKMISRPTLVRALWWATLVDEATLREWIVNIGQRDAEKRIAHLFCELHLRLHSVGLAEGGRIELPLTQFELAQTAGLSAVHVNRSLQSLRSRNFITLKEKVLHIENVASLRAFSGFNSNYLHLDRGKTDLFLNQRE